MNEEKLVRALRAIEGDLSRWDQAEFEGFDVGCGTTMCLAGMVNFLEGERPGWCMELGSPMARAQAHLGITGQQAEALFLWLPDACENRADGECCEVCGGCRAWREETTKEEDFARYTAHVEQVTGVNIPSAGAV